MVVVYIFEEEEWKYELLDFFKKEDITSMIDYIYSKSEIEKAKWFEIRSKYRWEYPQPENYFEYKNITYNGSDFCDECGGGLSQKEEFRVKKAPRWGKRNFLMLNWVEDEIFVTDKVINVLKANDIKGFKSLDVLNHKTNKPIENMKQIYVEGVLEPSFITLKHLIEKDIKCSKCGNTKYIITGRGLLFTKNAFEKSDMDIIKSYEKFGDGHICSSLIIVSKKVRDLIVSSELDKDLEFEPITFS